MREIKLLDCTLRDGGYLNDWEFGHNSIVNIFERLVSAGIDIIEVGFIDDRRPYDFNRTIMPNSKSVEEIYKDLDFGDTMLVGMIDYGTCDISNIIPAKDSILKGIRVIFKKHLRKEAMFYCKQLKDLGYAVFAQLVSITSYSDEELMNLIDLANEVRPYAVSIVDTYGLLHQENLLHYFTLLNQNLQENIVLGYHSHNNFQMAYANCIEFLAQNVERSLLIDGTIYGMGKSAGNAPIELLTMHLNQHYGKHYDTSQILEAIDSSVLEFYHQRPWGYNMFYYISASNDCHPNYVSYLMNKRTLSVKSMNAILSALDQDKKLMYDEKYIEQCYIDYQINEVNDQSVYESLNQLFSDKKIILIGPGNQSLSEDLNELICNKGNDVVKIAINFIPENIKIDYLFLTNAKRYLMLSTKLSMKKNMPFILATSNVTSMKEEFSYVVNYGTLLDRSAPIVDNSLLMLIKLLHKMHIQEIGLIGFDGYLGDGERNYIEQNMEYCFSKEQAEQLNRYVSNALKEYNETVPIFLLTDSLYNL